MRVITTVDELEELKPLAVILIGLGGDMPGCLAAQKDDDWYVAGERRGKSSKELFNDIVNEGIVFIAPVAFEGVTPEEIETIYKKVEDGC